MPPSLTESQQRTYSLEKTENFRWVTQVAKTSPRTLTSLDLAPLDLQVELSDIGQYAELAHGKLSPEFIWENMERLLQPNFPLQGYNALSGSELCSSFRGTVGGMQGYIAYQSNKLIVAFSGTSNIVQTLNNIDVRLVAYPSRDGPSVHGGFWRLFNGVRSLALDALAKAFQQHEVHELILTGHSLGGAMCYLFAMDALEGQGQNTSPILPSTLKTLTLAVFGCPRVGNLALVQRWRSLCADRIKQGLSIREYSVKGYNDGVPLTPPQTLGFCHFAQTPLYFVHGCLFQIPASESEYGRFVVEDDAAVHAGRVPFLDHPLGGHSYYNSRDMERVLRTMRLLYSNGSEQADWDGYLDRFHKQGENSLP